jgi:hypothetical protein
LGYALIERIAKPLLEILLATENLRHQEVHQTPKFHHVILQGRPSEEQPPLSVKAKESLPPLTLEVLDVLGLIKDHIIPLLTSEGEVILNHKLVRGYADMEAILFGPAMALDLSLFLASKVGKNFKGRTPLLELHLPVNDDSRWDDNQVGTPDSLVAGK